MKTTKALNLVLSGAGTRYPAHAGAVSRLLDDGHTIKAVAGVSGGAIIAAAIGCGYDTPDKLKKLMIDTKPKWSMWDVCLNPLRALGLLKGRKMHRLLKKHLDRRLGDTDIPIKIVAVKLADFDLQDSASYTVFGTEETPDVTVYDAVRASTAIPIFFAPQEINGEKYVDGGLTASYPLDIYGTGEDTIGVRMLAKGVIKAPSKFPRFVAYLKWLMEAMFAAMDREHIDDAVHARTLYLRVDNPTIELNMTLESLGGLWESGYSQMAQVLPEDWQAAH